MYVNTDWVAYDWNDPSSRPPKYGKYFVHRKDGKVHWETWNGSGWAYNEKVITHWQEVKPPCLKAGYVKIEGCDKATGFERICKESELQKVGKEIFAEHPGEDGYYNFTKYLWVNYPDHRPECRLDDLVPYEKAKHTLQKRP